jgi:lysophospholipase L1-like esterase
MILQLFRTLTCLLTALLTLELCARLEDTLTQGAPFLGAYHQNILYDRPGTDFHGVPGARYLKWQLNSLGYRGSEPRPGVFRVACVGASETFGLYESAGKEWPQQLDELLRQKGKATVVNTAYPGSNLRTHLHQAPRMLATAKPDAIVLYTSVAAYIHADFYGVLKAGMPPAREIRLATKAKELFRRTIPAKWLLPWRRQQIEAAMRGRETETTSRIRPENVALFEQDLNRLLDYYAGKGVPVIIVTHANRFGDTVTPEEGPMMAAWRQAYPMLREEGFLDMEKQLNDRLRQAAAVRGLTLVDAAREIPSGPPYFADFVHFTDKGAARLASLVAEAVTRIK